MIIDDIELILDEEEMKSTMGKRIERILKSERNLKHFNEAKAILSEVIQPAAVWNQYKVLSIDGETVSIANLGDTENIKVSELSGASLVEVVSGAEELVLIVVTIGNTIQCEVKKCMKSNDMFKGLVLDLMGSWAVDKLKNLVYDRIKRYYHAERGWNTSISVSPGETDWSLMDQRVIFNLLKNETDRIGVTLNESLMMYPLKSVSFAVGASKDHLGKEQGTNCEMCKLKGKCRFSIYYRAAQKV